MTQEEAIAEFERCRGDMSHVLRTYVRIKMEDGATRELTNEEVAATMDRVNETIKGK